MNAAGQDRISGDMIAKARAVDMVELARRYLKLERHGREWRGLCPFHKEKTPSFKVEHARTHYHCFGCGAHGDAIDFVSKLEKISFAEAVERLTGDSGHSTPLRIVTRNEKPVDLNTDPEVRRARAMWSCARPAAGSPIESAYFPARALPTPPPLSVRFVPNYAWRGDHSMMFPAQLVAVQAPDGRVIGTEATALTTDCRRKAFVDSRDKIGLMAAGAARFAAATHRLGICEGAETAIAAQHILGLPCWASLGAGRFARMAIPDTVTELFILADSDAPGGIATDKALDAYARAGRSLYVEFPPEPFNDWNDVLLARKQASAA